MTELEKLKEENYNLKQLVDQAYHVLNNFLGQLEATGLMERLEEG